MSLMAGPLAPYTRRRRYVAKTTTLADAAPVFLQWLARVRQVSPHTVTAYHTDLRTFLGFCRAAGIHRPGQLAVRDVEVFLAWIRETRGLRAASVVRALSSLRTFYRFLMREGVVDRNVPGLAQAPRKVRPLPDYLPPHAQATFLGALAELRTTVGRRDHALICTALLTGLRAAELTTLRLEDVDLAAGTLRTLGKGAKERELPIVPALAEVLGGYLRDVRPRLLRGRSSGYVFPPQRRLAGRPMATRTLRSVVARRAAALLGRHAWPHLFRHSFASKLYDGGADPLLIMEALGHTQLATTMIYTHISSKKRRADIARFLGA